MVYATSFEPKNSKIERAGCLIAAADASLPFEQHPAPPFEYLTSLFESPDSPASEVASIPPCTAKQLKPPAVNPVANIKAKLAIKKTSLNYTW